ncbi:hypothetical protein DPMN_107555 [Dreissena polymorpha]|uniref:Uncharacterized protein n=1 Tax=Dreissena polymorpha TaxID=45954 RepID=A0A9D4K759_DREPO|nr:hypothetical protein DPMN_107555 [Dreissena polymorpha]
MVAVVVEMMMLLVLVVMVLVIMLVVKVVVKVMVVVVMMVFVMINGRSACNRSLPGENFLLSERVSKKFTPTRRGYSAQYA